MEGEGEGEGEGEPKQVQVVKLEGEVPGGPLPAAIDVKGTTIRIQLVKVTGQVLYGTVDLSTYAPLSTTRGGTEPEYRVGPLARTYSRRASCRGSLGRRSWWRQHLVNCSTLILARCRRTDERKEESRTKGSRGSELRFKNKRAIQHSNG